MESGPGRVTQLLRTLDLRDQAQAEALLALVYDELRGLAAGYMRREAAAFTLQPTALVHEAYLRLVGGEAIDWDSRRHFFGVAARAMRQVLVDHARRRQALRRGGALERVTLDPELMGAGEDSCGILDLHTALERLSALDERMGRLVELRFFTGFTLEESAAALGVSRRTAAKDWSVARLWLKRELSWS